jgi:hypothetical protein
MDSVNKWIYLAIGLVVLLSVVAGIVPTINLALGNLSAIAGLPLASLFAVNGIVMLIIMAGILIAVVYGVMKHTKK